MKKYQKDYRGRDRAGSFQKTTAHPSQRNNYGMKAGKVSRDSTDTGGRPSETCELELTSHLLAEQGA